MILSRVHTFPGLGLPRSTFYEMEEYCKEGLNPELLIGTVNLREESFQFHLAVVGFHQSLRLYAIDSSYSHDSLKRSLAELRSHNHPSTGKIIGIIFRSVDDRIVKGWWMPAWHRLNSVAGLIGL